jgi:hypothetical protein
LSTDDDGIDDDDGDDGDDDSGVAGGTPEGSIDGAPRGGVRGRPTSIICRGMSSGSGVNDGATTADGDDVDDDDGCVVNPAPGVLGCVVVAATGDDCIGDANAVPTPSFVGCFSGEIRRLLSTHTQRTKGAIDNGNEVSQHNQPQRHDTATTAVVVTVSRANTSQITRNVPMIVTCNRCSSVVAG